MSVLFKALARAAKSRGARGGDQGGGGYDASGGGRSRRRRLQIVALSGIALVLVMFLGGLFLFGDEIYSAFDELTSDQAVHPLPVPVVPRNPLAGPQLAQPLVAPVLPPSAEPAAAGAPPPAAETGAPAAAGPTVAGPAAETASTPAATDSPPVAPTIPVPGSPPGQVAVAPPAPPPATVAAAPPAPAPPPVAVSSKPPSAAAGVTNGGPVKPTVLKAAEPKPEEDLPAILARIRREKASPAISEPVKVDRRTASADLTGADGASVVDVEVTTPPRQEEATQAYDLLLHGEYEGALDLYRKALKTAPGSLPLLLGKATAEHKLRRTIDARETYRKALAVDPENREALTNMTAIVADQAPDQALQDLRGLQKSYPSFSPIVAQIASIEDGRNNLAGAITTLGTAVALSPENGLYRLNMAVLQDRAGMAAEAAASYQAAIDLLGPSGTMPVPLEQIRKRLRFLQGR